MVTGFKKEVRGAVQSMMPDSFAPLLSMGVADPPSRVDIDGEGYDTDDGDDAVFAADEEEEEDSDVGDDAVASDDEYMDE